MKKFTLLFFVLIAVSWQSYAQDHSTVANAQPLAIDSNCVGTSGGANSGDPTGFDNTDGNVCSGNYSSGDDYIFSYTGNGSALQLDLTTTNTWSGMMVTEGTPTGGTCVGNSNSSSSSESLLTSALTSGVTYYIHISTFATPQSTGQFCLDAAEVAPAVPPANDLAGNAESVPVNADETCTSFTPGTINLASASGEDEGACSGTEDDDVWYSFVALGTTQNIQLNNVTGGTTDLYHSVWEGTPGSLTNLSCSDPNTSTINGLTIGNTYLLRVYSWTSTPGQTTTFDVCIQTPPPPPPPPPANNLCVDAEALTINSDLVCTSTTPGTIESATASGEDEGACSGTEDDDVWYSFVAQGETQYIELLNVSGSTTDLYHSVWEGSCGALTNLLCSDPDSSTISGLTIGNTYLLRVYSWTATSGQDTIFDVCITTEPAFIDTNCGGGFTSTAGGIITDSAPLVDVLAVSLSPTDVLTDLDIAVSLNHTFTGDVDMTLTSPSGTVVELTTDNGVGGDDYHNTLFDQSAATSIVDGDAPFTGTFSPEGNLDDFNGEVFDGNWILTIEDDAGGDDGSLISWCLFPTVIPPPDCTITSVNAGAQGACSYDGTTSTYSQDVVITYADDPGTGDLNVNGQLFAVTTSPQTVTLTGLLADTLDVDVDVFFTDLPLCSFSQAAAFTAPGECIPPVNCATSEVRNTTYCYDNNDTMSWSFTSSINGPLLVSFNAGQLSPTFDLIEIYDSIDDSGTVLFNAGLADMTGQQFLATSGSVFMRMNTTGVVSCQDNAQVPLDWDVSCFVLPDCTITDVAAGAQTACDPGTITYTQDIIVTYNDAPATGTLDVNGQSFTIGTSPQTVTLVGLPANGEIVDVNVGFSQEAFCTYDETSVFEAPENCTPVPTDNCGANSSSPGTAVLSNTTITDVITVVDPSLNWIDDLNVIVAIDHTFIGDLDVILTSPNGTEVHLFDSSCNGDNDFNIQFDDSGAPIDCTGDGPILGTFTADGDLSDFNDQEFNGDWTLTVTDNATGDDGTLVQWCLVASTVPPPACPNPIATEGAATCVGGPTALLEAFTACQIGGLSAATYTITDAGGESGHSTVGGNGNDTYAANEPFRMEMDVDLPAGAIVQSTTVYVEYTSDFPGELRITATTPSGVSPELAPGSSGNEIGDFNTIDYPNVDGLWTFRFLDTWNDGFPADTVDATITNITITVDYLIAGAPAEHQWYSDEAGGALLATGSTFDPVPHLPGGDTNTPGLYSFWAACSNEADCRFETIFEVIALPVIVVPDNIVSCGPVTLEDLDEGGYFTEPNGDGDEYEGGDEIEESTVLYVFAETFTDPNCTIEGTFSIIIGDTFPTTTGAEICAGGPSASVSAAANCVAGLQELTASTSGSGGQSGLTATGGSGDDLYENNTDINITVPPLPAGATITGTSIAISFETSNGSFQSELRVNANPPGGQTSQTDLAPGTGFGGTTLDADLGAWNGIDPIGDWNFQFRDSFNDTGTDRGLVDADITDITITVTYLGVAPGEMTWYTNATGGGVIGTGNSFDPIDFLPSGNTDTPGTYTLYAACSTAPACRTAVDFVIHPQTLAIAPEDALTCDSYALPAIIADGSYFSGPNATGTAYNPGDLITETATVYVFATNAGNCTAEDSFVVTIDNELPRMDDVAICAGDEARLMNSSACPTGDPVTVSVGTGGVSGLGFTDPDTYDDNTSITINVPNGAAGATIVNTNVTISYTTLNNSWRNELRVEAIPPAGAVQSDLEPSTLIFGGTVTDAQIGTWGTDNPSGDWTFRFREDFNDSAFDGPGTPDADITNITITVTYALPTDGIVWYETATSTVVIGTGDTFDPTPYLPGGNTNTIGSYTFYAECSALPGCRNEGTVEIYGPTIVCPGDIEVDNDPTICGAAVTYTIDADANCPNSVITQTEGLASGEVFPVGTTTNTFVVTDAGGNTETCSFDVTVEDNEAPQVNCAEITVVLDGNGDVNVAASALDMSSTDNCGIASYTIDGNSSADFSCSDTGGDLNQLIISQYIDGQDANDCIEIYNGTGNTVELTGNYSIAVYVNGSTTPQVWPLLGSIANDDVYVVCQQFADAEGMGVVDLINGIMFNGNDAVSLDHNGSAVDIIGIIGNNPGLGWTEGSISTKNTSLRRKDDVFAGNISNTNSGLASEWIQRAWSNMEGLGDHDIEITGLANNVILTVTDIYGNESTCVAAVTVVDDTPPTAIAQDVIVQLDASGNGSTSGILVNNGSSDVCGIASLELDQTDFTCANVGIANPVVLTVTDVNGNTATATANVTVIDGIAPDAVAQDVVVVLDAAGNGSVTAAQVNNGSTDACGVDTITVSPNTFDCSNVGDNEVTLVVTDVNGNVSTATANVDVQDNTNPDAVCQALTVTLDANGSATIVGADVDGGSTDACGIASLDVSPNTFGCDELGDNTVTLTVTDNNGNVSTCTAIVTVEGNPITDLTVEESELPEFCQGAVVTLTASSTLGVTYDWSTGESGESIEVGANGDYTVTATSATNCTATFTYTVTGFDPGALTAAYTIIATDEVHLHGDNLVQTGGVGVTKVNKKIKVHKASNIVEFAQASIIEVDGSSTVGTEINSPANPTIPTFLYNNESTNSSPDYRVRRNQTRTIGGSVYDKIEVEDNATLIFTSSNIYIDELKTKKNATIIFASCANVFINKKVKFDKNTTFNPDGNMVTVYVDDKFEVKEGSNVIARVHANDHEIKVKGKKNGSSTFMTGLFIGKKVKGNDNVVWNQDTLCEPCPIIETNDHSAPSNNHHDDDDDGHHDDDDHGHGHDDDDDGDRQSFDVKAWPNPSNTSFNVQLESANYIDDATIYVFDMNNKLVHTTEFGAEDKYNFGNDLEGGVYIVKVVQGKNMKHVRLVKY